MCKTNRQSKRRPKLSSGKVWGNRQEYLNVSKFKLKCPSVAEAVYSEVVGGLFFALER